MSSESSSYVDVVDIIVDETKSEAVLCDESQVPIQNSVFSAAPYNAMLCLPGTTVPITAESVLSTTHCDAFSIEHLLSCLTLRELVSVVRPSDTPISLLCIGRTSLPLSAVADWLADGPLPDSSESLAEIVIGFVASSAKIYLLSRNHFLTRMFMPQYYARRKHRDVSEFVILTHNTP